MGARNLRALIATAVLLFACSNTERPDAEFESPRVPEFDTGAATSSVLAPVLVDSDEDLIEAVHDGDDLVEVELTSCTLIGPDQWKIAGDVTMPDNLHSTTVRLGFVVREGDVGGVHPVPLTLAGEGPFAAVVDFLSPKVEQDQFRWPTAGYRPGEDGCEITLTQGSHPTKAAEWLIPATTSFVPLHGTAPSDSLQGLGIGASLADPEDPRLSWASLNWAGLAPGADTVWIPTEPLLPIRSFFRGVDAKSFPWVTSRLALKWFFFADVMSSRVSRRIVRIQTHFRWWLASSL